MTKSMSLAYVGPWFYTATNEGSRGGKGGLNPLQIILKPRYIL